MVTSRRACAAKERVQNVVGGRKDDEGYGVVERENDWRRAVTDAAEARAMRTTRPALVILNSPYGPVFRG